ncbi:selenocysteine-specific translation elongation factor [Romboutsia ilealis]|uniref:Selenocysteine-specific elongation factor n=1 Tax=Romboutsia faecis TaxID=2764597 RepID=A0ABR7JLR8_9FIRM|nr:selenocysteine-specific translation elongation factor [Romboutsia faecis]MBC5995648.1 selenocysteine-specific translation elongation factor [Romboutsia faecis]MRN23850.1 selenocysteine-specific translation elongation factor [Romboutsia ilealis]
MKNIIIGTAGHIDHGKTTLIKALTGRDTDTLKEEKQRGISINLGFTYFDLPSNKRAGIVDVPGHEKFIKNMLAGSSGIDIVLLVIACDEGVMPQTIEHLDILNFLDIKNGIIVLTKCQNADEDFKELVKEDIREKLDGSFLENVDMIEVDSISGYGIDKLINKIDDISNVIGSKKEDSPSRLNIDRVFSVKGFGTVITGTLLEGKIKIDDELQIYPKGIKAKIRGIQVHGENVEVAYAGQRTAINISNVKVEEIERGDVLADINSLEESKMLDVKISLVKHTNKELKHWDRLKLYHGTKEILCRAVPLDKDYIKNNESAYVQLRLEEGIVAKKGDRFVIRTYSPMETIGGGVIIDTSVKKHKKFNSKVIESLRLKELGKPKDIIEEYLKQNKERYLTIKELMSYTGLYESVIEENMRILIEDDRVIELNNHYIHIDSYKNLEENILDLLSCYHKKNRLKKGMSKEEIRSKVCPDLKIRDLDVVILKMENEKKVNIINKLISSYDFNVVLNDNQKAIKLDIQKKLRQAGLSSILTVDDLCVNNNYKEVLESMIGYEIELLDEKHIIDKDNYEIAKYTLINYIKENNSITLAEYRNSINSSRKNCLIILEHFDRSRVTKRIEDKRVMF